MDITSLYNVSSGAVKEAMAKSTLGVKTSEDEENVFGSMLNAAIDNLNTTNSYLSDWENEQVKFALGETENPHDLTVALEKASAALQYTVTVRDKFLEAYREIMQMQI